MKKHNNIMFIMLYILLINMAIKCSCCLYDEIKTSARCTVGLSYIQLVTASINTVKTAASEKINDIQGYNLLEYFEYILL